MRMGPNELRATVLSLEKEAIVVASRRHMLLPLDECLYGLQPTLPHPTRSFLHSRLARPVAARTFLGKSVTVPANSHWQGP